MNLKELWTETICGELGLSSAEFPRILTFIDFANVNHWFDGEYYDLEGLPLSPDTRVEIDLAKLAHFLRCFADDSRVYYGHDPANSGSLAFISAARYVFGKHRVFTKRIQQVRHDLTPADFVTNTRAIRSDDQGDFVFIPKCNFDVEITVDAIRLAKSYDTICLLSADADFAGLLRYLKYEKHKKVILIKGGHIDSSLGKLVNCKIDASKIKRYIAQIKKRKPGARPGSAESQPESTGRADR